MERICNSPSYPRTTPVGRISRGKVALTSTGVEARRGHHRFALKHRHVTWNSAHETAVHACARFVCCSSCFSARWVGSESLAAYNLYTVPLTYPSVCAMLFWMLLRRHENPRGWPLAKCLFAICPSQRTYVLPKGRDFGAKCGQNSCPNQPKIESTQKIHQK